MAGRVLVHFKSHEDRLRLWSISAFILFFIAGLFCDFSLNNGLIPINKNLWSTSFIFVSSGAGLVCLSLTYIAVDIYKVWSGSPFLYIGKNSILIYCIHGILHKYFPFSYSTSSTSHARQLQTDFIGASCWLLVSYYFYKIGFFVKI